MSIAIAAGSKLRATLEYSLMYLPHVLFKFAYDIFVVHCGYPLDDFGTSNLGSAHDIELPQPWRTPQCPWRMLPPLRSRPQGFLCPTPPNAVRLYTEHRLIDIAQRFGVNTVVNFVAQSFIHLHPMTEWNVCTFQDRFCVHNRRFAVSLVVILWLPQMRHLPSQQDKRVGKDESLRVSSGTDTGH